MSAHNIGVLKIWHDGNEMQKIRNGEEGGEKNRQKIVVSKKEVSNGFEKIRSNLHVAPTAILLLCLQ